MFRHCKMMLPLVAVVQFSAFSRELINNYNNKEQQWKSEQVELISKAAEYKELKDQFIKYEALLEEIQIAIIDKTSYERITVICKAIYNAKCVGVRCFDVKLAQDMKAHNSLTAIAMYDDLITKLTPCLRIPNIHIQQFIDEKADLHSKLKVMNVAASADDGTQHEWDVDQWMSSCPCKDDRNIEFFKERISEQMEAEEYKESLHQLNQSYAVAAAEWRKEKLDIGLKMQSIQQELTKLQQCVGVRCYDVKLAQDMKAHNSLTAIAMI
ncbi:hypothetical protein B566_EDAN014627 [Ephemera danica]|nr:hypothetical protein B566_EDAN014627 [Ephemera danica]